METWTTIAPLINREGPPVVGNPEDFEQVSEEFFTLHSDTDAVVDLLRDLHRGDSSDFRGLAAEAFATIASDCFTKVLQLETTAFDAGAIFARHASQLRQLRVRSDEALARAATDWNRRCQADTEVRDDEARLAAIECQIDELGGDNILTRIFWTPDQRAAVEELASQRAYVQIDLDASRQKQQLAQDDLTSNSKDWDRLHQDEKSLNGATAGKLKALDLGDLADPNSVEKFIGFIGHLAIATWEAFNEIGEYLVSEEFLRELKKSLDFVVEVLGLASAVLGVLALIPGLQALGAVATALATIAIALTLISQLVSAIQLSRGYIDLEEYGRDTFGNVINILPGPGKLATKGIAKAATRAVKKIQQAPVMRKTEQHVRSVVEQLPDTVIGPVKGLKPAAEEAFNEFVNPLTKKLGGAEEWIDTKIEDWLFDYRFTPPSGDGDDAGAKIPPCTSGRQVWIIDASSGVVAA